MNTTDTTDTTADRVAEQVRAWVSAHRVEVLGELAAWVRVPSVSSTGEGFPAATASAAEMLSRNGFAAEVLDCGGRPTVVGRRDADGTAEADGAGAAPHVLVYGHYDVQPAGPLDAWSSPPFDPEIRDGRMFGRGTADNKGQHLAQVLGSRALREIDVGTPCRLTVLLDGEEEIGSPHLGAALDRLTARPDLVLWSDGPVHASGAWCVSLGVRGIAIFTLTARGAEHPLHSGHWGGVAPDPAWELVQALATMRAPDGSCLVDGLEDTAVALSPGELAALQALPLDLPAVLAEAGVRQLAPPVDRGFYQRLTRPTFTLNSLTCHDTDDHRTIIPTVATARCDIRMVADQRSDQVFDAIRRHLEHHAPGIEFTPVESMEPSRTLPETAWTQTLLRAAEAGYGTRPLLVPAMGGSLPIAVLGERLDVPMYGLPFANVDERNHAADENLVVDMFLAGITAAATVQWALAHEAVAPGRE